MNWHLATTNEKWTYQLCEACTFGAGVQAPARHAQLYIHKEFEETVKAQGEEGLYSVPKFVVVLELLS